MYREDGRKNSQHREIALQKEKGLSMRHGCTKITTFIENHTLSRKALVVKVLFEGGSLPDAIGEVRVEKKQEELERILQGVFSGIFLEEEPKYVIIHKFLFGQIYVHHPVGTF